MISFFDFLTEGNPLSRLHQHTKAGRPIAILSAERSNLSPAENKARHNELKGLLKQAGFGYREAEGHSDGVKERSVLVHAKGSAPEHGRHLLTTVKRLGRHFGQDAVIYHSKNKARLHGTNDSGYPGKGKVAQIGSLKYNKPQSPFQTELRPGKRGKTSARFTTEELVFNMFDLSVPVKGMTPEEVQERFETFMDMFEQIGPGPLVQTLGTVLELRESFIASLRREGHEVTDETIVEEYEHNADWLADV